jgi:hypothetical protein
MVLTLASALFVYYLPKMSCMAFSLLGTFLGVSALYVLAGQIFWL